ncbi:MAG: hypothetical protein K2X45_20740 [Phreatobacter sp.]|nr:hypothetical protein [Phreatobacter sp.]
MADDIPNIWSSAAASFKEPIDWPVWPVVSLPSAKAQAGARDQHLRTSAGETVRVVISLKEKNGPGLEGVRLRLVAWPFIREHEVTATLEVAGGRNGVTIARVDAWPADPHSNNRARANPELRHLVGLIEGHHVHRFDDNARLGRSAFPPSANLPIARPIDGGIRSFRQFLAVVEREFLIEGIADFPPPPQWSSLI